MRIIFLILIIGTANASDFSIGLYTDHLQPGNFNENNELIAYRSDKYFAATMVNSYHQRTYAAGAYKEAVLTNHLRAGVNYGAVYGYCAEAFRYGEVFSAETCDQVMMPLISPYLAWDSRKYTFKIINLGTAIMFTAGVSIN